MRTKPVAAASGGGEVGGGFTTVYCLKGGRGGGLKGFVSPLQKEPFIVYWIERGVRSPQSLCGFGGKGSGTDRDRSDPPRTPVGPDAPQVAHQRLNQTEKFHALEESGSEQKASEFDVRIKNKNKNKIKTKRSIFELKCIELR